MQSEPLLLEKINTDICLIMPNGERYNFYSASDEDFKYTRPRFYTAPIYSFNNYLDIGNLENFEFPFMIFNDTLECPQMSLIRYDKDSVDLLNNLGLHIFLTENVIKYTGDRIKTDKHNYKSMLPKLKNNLGLMQGKFDDTARAFQLDSIQDLIYNNKLENVTVYSPEYGLESFSQRYKNIKFKYKDLDTSYRLNKIYSKHSYKEKSDLKYKFINYNWRFENYRCATAAYLINFDSKISWFHKISLQSFKQSMWFDIDLWEEDLKDKLVKGVLDLNLKSPIEIDTHVIRPTYISGEIQDRFALPNTHYQSDFISSKVFSDVFCTIVTESGYLDPTSYISEKTIFPIAYMMPFVIVGPPGALALLKKIGFKTFDKFWSEDYDNEKDHELRLKKIFKVIDYIDSLSYKELATLSEKMQEILIHNKNMLEKLILDEYRF